MHKLLTTQIAAMYSKIFNSSQEMFLQKCGNGVHLVPSTLCHTHNQMISLNKMLAMPFNVYFMDRDSRIQAANEAVPKSFNILSLQDTIGLTVREVAKKKSAIFSLQHDHEVMNEMRMIIKDESYDLLDDVFFPMLTIKFPWYHKNIMQGIFGISIMIDKDRGISLADSMNLLTETGLLYTQKSIFPGLAYNDIYFTEREKDILFHLVLGKSARKIAHILRRSPRTIEHHINNMKIKLNCNSKSDLIEIIIKGSGVIPT